MPGSLTEYPVAHSKMEEDNTDGVKRARTWQPSHQEEQREEREEEGEEEGEEGGGGLKGASEELKDVKECVFPPINLPQSQRRDKDDPAMRHLYVQQKKLEDNRCLLAELARIEQELRESLAKEEEKQKSLDQIRQEENRIRWRNLSFLSLSQRTGKAFVSSYYKNIPMHIYCLPITTVAHKTTKRRKKKLKK